MKIIKTKINDCVLIEPQVYEDKRGFFLETFSEKKYSKILGTSFKFLQDNHSRSQKNVLRGLHFQKNDPQGKLVRVVTGKVFDVAVDIRKNSQTFGEYVSVILSQEQKNQFWIPPGFAHGFVVLSEFADFEYKCTKYYDPDDESSIIWNDPDINIHWPIKNPLISEKDLNAPYLKDIVL
tara:strand:+ start:1468 stop:2004 length:537 start_codon:yes stop_codon:yes gene_type:complete